MAVDVARTVHTNERAATFTSSQWGIFFIRLVLGFIFLMHGGQKVFGWFGGHTWDQSAASMSTMLGIPLPLVYVSIFTELIGGIFLILGILSRIAAVGLIINMIVAIAMVHFKNGFFLSGGPGGPGFEYNVALIGMAIAIAIAGPGALSAVDWEGRLFKRP